MLRIKREERKELTYLIYKTYITYKKDFIGVQLYI